MQPLPPAGYPYKQLSASGQVRSDPGVCVLILCTSSTDLVIKVWDSTAASGDVVVSNMAVYAGEEYDVPAQLKTGLYVEFISGSGAVTVFHAGGVS